MIFPRFVTSGAGGASADASTIMSVIELAPPRSAHHDRHRPLQRPYGTTRPSSEAPGQFIHDHFRLRCSGDGRLDLLLGVMDIRYRGWSVPLQHKLFSIATDIATGTFVFGIFNGVVRQRAEVVDGLIMSCMRDANGTPIASKCLIERVGDLTGDPVADDARLDVLASGYPLTAAAAIPDYVRAHLWHDVGPEAMAGGATRS